MPFGKQTEFFIEDAIFFYDFISIQQRRSKPDDNWVRNISSRPLDKNETRVLSYGLKHSVTPKRTPTKAIVSSVEAALAR